MQNQFFFMDPNETLSSRLSKYVKNLNSVTLTKNKSTILTSVKGFHGIDIRIHKCFAKASDTVVKAVATFIKKKNRESSSLIDEYYNQHLRLCPTQKSKPRIKMISKGEFFNLTEILNDLNSTYFDNNIDAIITWGNKRQKPAKRWRRTKHITLGKYVDSNKLIIIHPHLDRKRVPMYVVEAIVHHEMCHQVASNVYKNGSRRIHTNEFKKLENTYKHLKKAQKWEKDNLDYLIRRPRA